MGKYRVKVLLIVVLIISFVSMITYKICKNDKEKTENNETMAVYIGDEEGNYSLSSSSSFPTDGYVLNTEKSKCTNGGVISQNSTTKKISVTVTSSDKCNLYFDVEPAKPVVTNVTVTGCEIITTANSKNATITGYYYSVNGSNYVSGSQRYTYLIGETGTYTVRVKVVDSNGIYSEIYTEIATFSSYDDISECN